MSQSMEMPIIDIDNGMESTILPAEMESLEPQNAELLAASERAARAEYDLAMFKDYIKTADKFRQTLLDDRMTREAEISRLKRLLDGGAGFMRTQVDKLTEQSYKIKYLESQKNGAIQEHQKQIELLEARIQQITHAEETQHEVFANVMEQFDIRRANDEMVIKDLKATIISKEEIIASLNEAVHDHEYGDLITKVEYQRESLADLNGTVYDQGKYIQDLEEKVATLTQRNDNLHGDNREMRSMRRQQCDQIQKLKAERDQQTTAIEHIKAEVKACRNGLGMINSQDDPQRKEANVKAEIAITDVFEQWRQELEVQSARTRVEYQRYQVLAQRAVQDLQGGIATDQDDLYTADGDEIYNRQDPEEDEQYHQDSQIEDEVVDERDVELERLRVANEELRNQVEDQNNTIIDQEGQVTALEELRSQQYLVIQRFNRSQLNLVGPNALSRRENGSHAPSTTQTTNPLNQRPIDLHPGGVQQTPNPLIQRPIDLYPGGLQQTLFR